jgi:hypothetical protein
LIYFHAYTFLRGFTSKNGGSAWIFQGVTRGKEQILCYYCGKETRKDNLERHAKARNPGKPTKLKLKATGMPTLMKLIGASVDETKEKDTNNNKDALESDFDEDTVEGMESIGDNAVDIDDIDEETEEVTNKNWIKLIVNWLKSRGLMNKTSQSILTHLAKITKIILKKKKSKLLWFTSILSKDTTH